MKLTVGSIVCAMSLWATSTWADDSWTFPVQLKQEDGTFTPTTYESLDSKEVSKKWKLCVSVPHVKDAYFLAVTYGAISGAKQLGVEMDVVAAGSYENLLEQARQIEDCIAAGANAVIITAISPTGLNPVIAEARKKGIVIVDLINGIQSDDVTAKMIGNYGIAGGKVAEYLMAKHPKGSGEARVLWLPGPAGVSWAEDGLRGFKEAIVDSEVKIVDIKYGDSGKTVQMQLLQDAIQTHPDLQYIVGNVPAAEGAVQILREYGYNPGDVGVFAFYYAPSMHEGIRNGMIAGAVTDSAVMMARTAVDQAIRALEGKEFYKEVQPDFLMIDSSNINDYDVETSLAPTGWRPVFHVD